MAKGSARQRKKIAKRIAQKSLYKFSIQIDDAIKQNRVQIEDIKPTKVTPKKEELPKPTHKATTTDIISKEKPSKRTKKKLSRKQKKKEKKLYRGKSQEQYYRENPDKQYTNEAVDMTEEYATNIVNDLESLPNTAQKDILLDLFYTNYARKGGDYIQQLHDTGADTNIHDIVEVAIAQYKGYLPDKVFMSAVNWLNVGVPIDARNTGVDNDLEDISSEVYE